MAKIDAYQGVRVFLTKKARKDKKDPDAPAAETPAEAVRVEVVDVEAPETGAEA